MLQILQKISLYTALALPVLTTFASWNYAEAHPFAYITGSLSESAADALYLRLDGTTIMEDDAAILLGADSDISCKYDEATDNQFICSTTTSGATATTDPLFLFLVPETPTADQEVFGIGKGAQTVGGNIYTIDEDGDSTQAGSGTFGGTGQSEVGGLVVNPLKTSSGVDNDFNVHGDTVDNLIQADSSADGVGFFNATPVVQPSAYTQTYSTADKTHAARTAPAAGTGSGADATTFSGAECDALVADQQDTAQALNSLIDDLQALGLIQ